MTDTFPKTAEQTNTKERNPQLPTNGYVGGHTTVSREELIPNSNSIQSTSSPSPKPQQKPGSLSVGRQLFPSWGNLSIQSKLSLLLIAGAAVPVIAVTQGLVWFSQHNAQKTLEETLQTRNTSLREDYTLWYKGESAAQAYSIAKTIEATNVNLQNSTQIERNRSLLQFLVSVTPQEKLRSDSYKSFRIITDSRGKTLEQFLQLHTDYPLGSSSKNEEIFKPVSLPTGIDLGDVPIIKDALRTGRPLSGVELVEGKFMQRLGLDKQATVSLKSQSSQNTYPAIDQGKAGLVSMAVNPIRVQGKVVGFAVVGQLLNKHHSLVDTFAGYYNTAASIFAKDLQVSTTVPYEDSKTRATGTRVPREVAEVVLNQGQEFFGQANILGQKYLTAYSPLYDHQKELNPTQAKPVGMVFVAMTPETVESAVGRLQLIGYGIGGGILLLAGLIAIPVAGTFSSPIRRLAAFAQQVGEGKQGVRLENTERLDEIGVLSREMNQMAAGIEASITAQRQELERARMVKDITMRLAQFPQLEGIFDTAVQEIRLALKTDRVVVYSFNENWQGTVIAESVTDGWPRALGAKIDDPCFAQKYVERYRQGRVQATENIYIAGLTECYIKQLEQFAVKANLVAPILQDNQLLGLLIAHQCSDSRAWQHAEIDLFAQLATQVGFALDRANLLDQQRTAKEQLQARALDLLVQVEPISKGDLTIRASVTADEIGTIADSYNATVANLRKIVTQVQAAATQVAATTSSNEVSVQELSDEAMRQTQGITSALDRIQEMSNSIRAVATSAQQAEAAVQQATTTVQAGEVAMNRTVEGIVTIRETVAETSKKVQRLGESSQKISKVVNLIGTFAAQTNLLALKASIEAARAGEEGRGFAVLAEEVRSLARQSTVATAEIESLVAAIQTETKEVVAAMEAGTQQVAEGTHLVDETRISLNKITAVSAEIGELVKAIASSAVAQSQASFAVTQTMTDVAVSAQHTSNGATLVSDSFKELLAVALELQASVGQFKVTS